MLVERDDVALGAVLVLDAEDPLAFGVEQTLLDEFVDATAGGEGGVQGEPGVGPLGSAGALLFHALADATVADVDEAEGELAVIADQAPVDLEGVHLSPLPRLCDTRRWAEAASPPGTRARLQGRFQSRKGESLRLSD